MENEKKGAVKRHSLTPYGKEIAAKAARNNVTMKELALAVGIHPAQLTVLLREHLRRGKIKTVEKSKYFDKINEYLKAQAAKNRAAARKEQQKSD